MVVFEEYPERYLERAEARGQRLRDMRDAGRLELIYLRPLDLSVDETLFEILESVRRLGATRVAIDSLSGFEVALAPEFREDFRESLYRLVGALTATGVTVFMTMELVGGYPSSQFTSERVSFITDDILIQRFVEIGGRLRRVLAVVKMRGSGHSDDFRTYEITEHGAAIGGALGNYQGILTGVPELQSQSVPPGRQGLTDQESAMLDSLARAGPLSDELLAQRLGVPLSSLAPGLARLLALGYATSDDAGVFRAVALHDG